MLAREVMGPVADALRPDDLVERAQASVSASEVDTVPVVDRAGCLQGVVAGRGVVPARPGSLGGGRVGEVMRTRIPRCSPDTDLAEVAAVMLAHDLRAVPVVDDGQMLGVVTDRDLLRTIVPARPTDER